MTKSELIACLVAHGYAPDRWGHYQRETIDEAGCLDRTYRYKVTDKFFRKDVKFSGGWTRVSSGWLSQYRISEGGKVEKI